MLRKNDMIYMMSANDAYKITTENKKRKIAKQIEDITRVIEKAIDKGEYHAFYSHDIEYDIMQILYELGYTVTDCSNPINGVEFSISWKELR